ncbi:hypothetical protein RchiOBHm_Chr5g0017431 [Rosa chinensis]|uniref:Uncharacterized protein n=1 Tax=Rosa chinensis TaxID=74649 RepID=A0A2P6Q6H2_ROSCH|nr:hypothetical protein RchiOBHm_Chr5g0017431 [Rosa chinensis]
MIDRRRQSASASLQYKYGLMGKFFDGDGYAIMSMVVCNAYIQEEHGSKCTGFMNCDSFL